MPDILIRTQTLEMTEVQDVVITDITQDGADYLREFRFTGVPPGGGDPIPLLTVRVRTDDPEKIKVTSPEMDF